MKNEIKDRVDNLEAKLDARDIVSKHVQKRVVESESALAQIQERLEVHRKNIEYLTNTINGHVAQNAKLESQELVHLRHSMNSYTSMITEAQGKIKDMQERAARTDSKLKNDDKTRDALNGLLSSLESKTASIDKSLSCCKKEILACVDDSLKQSKNISYVVVFSALGLLVQCLLFTLKYCGR
jgi:chromosome segregation ATPase